MGLYTLDICGWQKKQEIPDWIAGRGIVRIVLPKPLEVLPRTKDVVMEDNVATIDLRWDGKVFRYE